MISLQSLMDVMVETWQTVTQLLAAMDGEVDAIYKFAPGRPEYPNYQDALAKLPTPGMMVSHVATTLGNRGAFTQWRHIFRVDFKVPGELGSGLVSYADVMKYLVDGKPTDYGTLSLMQCQFIDLVDSMEDVVFTTQLDPDGKLYYRMEFALQERVDTTNE